MGYVFRDSVLVRFREVRFERVCFEVRFRRGRSSGMCLGAKIREVHFGEVCFEVRFGRVRFSGLLFWLGFVRYVLRRCISG